MSEGTIVLYSKDDVELDRSHYSNSRGFKKIIADWASSDEYCDKMNYVHLIPDLEKAPEVFFDEQAAEKKKPKKIYVTKTYSIPKRSTMTYYRP